MVLTYYINDVQIISSTGTITSSCSLSQCNGYTIDIKVSGDCNSTALAEAIPNSSCCIKVCDSVSGKDTSYTGCCGGSCSSQCQDGSSSGSCSISASNCSVSCV